jgi:hypothetical protein
MGGTLEQKSWIGDSGTGGKKFQTLCALQEPDCRVIETGLW